jgi:2-oxoglutarate dehydrogenase complex dehydrogenase (E1) component-like enzyme
MLRIFKILGLRHNRALTVFPRRDHSYQTSIYTSNFEPQSPQIALNAQLDAAKAARNVQPNLYRFIKAYQQSGHKQGRIDPLEAVTESVKHIELDLDYYGLSPSDQGVYATDGLLNLKKAEEMSLAQIESYLKATYSGNMTIEFDFINSEAEKMWIVQEFEAMQAQELDYKDKLEMLKLLLKSQVNLGNIEFDLCFIV